MTKLLITGGAGFIGANFVHYTLKNRPEYQITVVDKLTYAGNPDSLNSVLDQIDFVTGDICDKELMDRLVGDIRGEVVVGIVGGRDQGVIFVEHRVIVMHVAGVEAVEI